MLADRGETVVAAWQLLKQAERNEVVAGKERAAAAEAAAAAGLPPPGTAPPAAAAANGRPSALLADATCCVCGGTGGGSPMVSCEGIGCLGVTAHTECVGLPPPPPPSASGCPPAPPQAPWLCVVCALNPTGAYQGDGDPLYGGGMQRGRRAAAVAGVAALTASVGSRKLQTQHSARGAQDPTWG